MQGQSGSFDQMMGGSWPPEAPVAPWIDLESAGTEIFLIVPNNSEGTQVELCI